MSIVQTLRQCLSGTDDIRSIADNLSAQTVVQWLLASPTTRSNCLSCLIAAHVRTCPNPSSGDNFYLALANYTGDAADAGCVRQVILDAVRLTLDADDLELEYPSTAKRWAMSLLVELEEEAKITPDSVAQSAELREGSCVVSSLGLFVVRACTPWPAARASASKGISPDRHVHNDQ
jgi:hypothetical protein